MKNVPEILLNLSYNYIVLFRHMTLKQVSTLEFLTSTISLHDQARKLHRILNHRDLHPYLARNAA